MFRGFRFTVCFSGCVPPPHSVKRLAVRSIQRKARVELTNNRLGIAHYWDRSAAQQAKEQASRSVQLQSVCRTQWAEKERWVRSRLICETCRCSWRRPPAHVGQDDDIRWAFSAEFREDRRPFNDLGYSGAIVTARLPKI